MTANPRDTFDAAALAAAFDGNARAVFDVASRLGGPDLADDVTQEVFMRLWRRPEQFDPARGTLRTYLVTMARSMAKDAARSAGSRHQREARAHNAWPVDRTTADPEPKAIRTEAADIVVRALDQLGDASRDAIVVAYFGGLSYREAALALGLPEGTLKSRIRAGLRELRNLLAPATDLLGTPTP